MKSTQELATRIDAPLASTQAKRKHSPFKFRWLLVSLIVLATATSSAYAQAWRYQPKESWEYHPKKSWQYNPKTFLDYHPKTSPEYHPKSSWTYHPKQKQQPIVSRERGARKDDYRITCTHPLIAERVAEVTGDRVESFDIDFGRWFGGFIPYPLRAGMVLLIGRDEHALPEDSPVESTHQAGEAKCITHT